MNPADKIIPKPNGGSKPIEGKKGDPYPGLVPKTDGGLDVLRFNWDNAVRNTLKGLAMIEKDVVVISNPTLKAHVAKVRKQITRLEDPTVTQWARDQIMKFAVDLIPPTEEIQRLAEIAITDQKDLIRRGFPLVSPVDWSHIRTILNEHVKGDWADERSVEELKKLRVKHGDDLINGPGLLANFNIKKLQPAKL